MDEEDRYSASSGESERDNDNENDNDNDNENDNDEVMDDAEDDNENNEEGDGDGDDNDNENEEDDGDGDGDGDQEGSDNDDDGEPEDGQDQDQDQNRSAARSQSQQQSPSRAQSRSPSQQDQDQDQDDSEKKPASASTPKPVGPRRPSVRPEAINARLYDIVPTMAAPQATSVNAMAITPDLRYWFTGGSDGYIRKYDGPGTINGKLPLTVAQRHPFVDSVTKAGILMSYWENEEPSAPGRGDSEPVLSPVYSLAVHSEALWLLSGLESGGINLQSVRHDEGKKITCLQQHSNAVSVLTLANDEKSVLSGSWDKNIFDWDLNTGQVKRSFDGTGGQISAIELRPACGDPVPTGADELMPSNTISTNNGLPERNGFTNGAVNGGGQGERDGNDGGADSPAHESLFGGSDAGSLFGETAGEQPFGHDEDDFGGSMNMMSGHEHEGGMDHSADMAMAGIDTGAAKSTDSETVPAVQPPAQPDAMDIDKTEPTMAAEPAATVPGVPDGPLPDQPKVSSPEQAPATGPDGVAQSMPYPAHSPSAQSAQSSGSSQSSPNTFLSAAMDGTVRIWDRRVPNPVARIGNRPGVPPWCMSACWSPDGNMIYAGRRNGTVEEFDVRKAKRGWEPERVLKFPAGSGAVSALKPMANGRHLVCASHDILRLYDLRDSSAFKHSTVPFLIIPGPPRAGVVSGLYVDPTSRFMLSTAGTRGWEGTSTEVLIGYEINVVGD